MVPPSSVLDAQISFPFSIPPPTGAFVLGQCLTAPLPPPSLGLWWQQMVCCVQPGRLSRGHPALMGTQRRGSGAPSQAGAARGHCAAHKSLVCAPGWGGEEFGFSLSFCIPLKRQPSVFRGPADGSGFRGMRELQLGTERGFTLLSRWAELGAELPALPSMPNPPAQLSSLPGASLGWL